MAQHARDRDLERRWRQRLREWERSGLSGRDFCRRHALSEPSFYAWRREIARRDRERAAAGARSRPACVPVRIVATPALEVVLHGGRVVRVGHGFDAAHLRAVLTLLTLLVASPFARVEHGSVFGARCLPNAASDLT